MAAWDRTIAHVDMDSFYVSVEVRDDPKLRGKPVAVGGSSDFRGVVSSASYEARRFGVRSAMPMSTAKRRCPDLVVVPGNMAKYRDASGRLRAIFDDFSPAVEPLSLDEAFLDLTGAERLLGTPREIGEAIRRRIRDDLSLTGSVGISNSKFVAKLASDHDKPDGLTIVPPEDVVSFVQSLPLERLWGVGPRTREALQEAGIRTIAALARADERVLSRALGSSAVRLIRLARGEDSRPVVTEAPAKSLSHEITFGRDEQDTGRLEAVLLALCEKVSRRARRAGVAGRTVTFRFRRPDFTTLSRSRTFAAPVSDVSPGLRGGAGAAPPRASGRGGGAAHRRGPLQPRGRSAAGAGPLRRRGAPRGRRRGASPADPRPGGRAGGPVRDGRREARADDAGVGGARHRFDGGAPAKSGGLVARVAQRVHLLAQRLRDHAVFGRAGRRVPLLDPGLQKEAQFATPLGPLR